MCSLSPNRNTTNRNSGLLRKSNRRFASDRANSATTLSCRSVSKSLNSTNLIRTSSSCLINCTNPSLRSSNTVRESAIRTNGVFCA